MWWHKIRPYVKQYAVYLLVAAIVLGVSQVPSVQAFMGRVVGGGIQGNAGRVVKQAVVPNTASAAYFPFDENADNVAGSTTNDLSVGTVSQTTGKIGKAASFSGNLNDGLSNTSSEFTVTNTGFTISSWVYLTSLPSESVIASKYTSDSGPREYLLEFNGGSTNRFLFYMFDASNNYTGVTSTVAVSANQWYHVVGWLDYSGGVQGITVNGTTTTAATTMLGWTPGTPATFRIGARNNTFQIGHTGYIDEVSFWRRTLSTAEISTLYNGGLGLTYANFNNGLKKNLVSHWTLDEASGTRKDSNPHTPASTSTVTNATLTTGRFGRAYSFNGTSSGISVPDNDALDLGDTETGPGFTVSVWYKGTGASQFKPIASKTSGAAGWVLYSGNDCKFGTTGTKICFRVGNASTSVALTSASTYADTNWHHIVAVMTPLGSTQRPDLYLYIDGKLDGNASSIGTFSSGCGCGTVNTTTPMYVGYDGSTGYTNATIDDLRIYNDDLTAAMATKLYAGTPPPSCDQTCIGWWKMDETSGTSATDSSGQNNTGTYTGSPTLNSEGIYAGAMKIDGTAGKYLDAGTADALNLTSNYFTISAWIKFTSTSGTQWLVARDQAGSRGFAWGFINGQQTYSVGGNGSSGVGSTLTAGTWYHVVITSQRPSLTTNKFYVNGRLDYTAVGANPVPNVTGVSTSIGERKYSGFEQAFNGTVDDVRIYNRALNDDEIAELYRAGVAN